MIKIGINGFGRIGRAAFKVALDKHADEVDIVAINDLTDAKTLAHLLKYDSVYGVYQKEISSDPNHLIISGKKQLILAEKDPILVLWKDLNIDVVIESTGRFTSLESATSHLKAGAKKVVISAPSDDTPTNIIGVNSYNGENVINNGSCTTNCVGPVTAVIHSHFKILKAFMTTIHAYTAEQDLSNNIFFWLND